MDNPRSRFATAVKLRLDELGLNVQGYAEKLATILVRRKLRERGSEVAAIAYVFAVLNEHRTVPKGCEAAWAVALGWAEGSEEYAAFLTMVEAARAWGKSDGRAHVARLESENVVLTARVAAAEKALAKSEAKHIEAWAVIQELKDRIAFLEAGELKRRRPGADGR